MYVSIKATLCLNKERHYKKYVCITITYKGTLRVNRSAVNISIRYPIKTYRSLAKVCGIYARPFQRHLFSQHNNIISITYIHLQIMSKTCNIVAWHSRPVDPHFEQLVTHAYAGFN